jgi:hypothetical protein
MGRASYGIIACVLKVSRTTVYRWVQHTAIQLPEPAIPLEITEIEFDEIRWCPKVSSWLSSR